MDLNTFWENNIDWNKPPLEAKQEVVSKMVQRFGIARTHEFLLEFEEPLHLHNAGVTALVHAINHPEKKRFSRKMIDVIDDLPESEENEQWL